MNWCFSTHSPRTVLSIVRPLLILRATLQSPTKLSRNGSLSAGGGPAASRTAAPNKSRTSADLDVINIGLDSQTVFHFRPAINAFRGRKRFFDLNQTGVKLRCDAQSGGECVVDRVPSYFSLPFGGQIERDCYAKTVGLLL